MSSKTLRGTYLHGYKLSASTADLTVAASGYVEGDGLVGAGSGAYAIYNLGRVTGAPTGVTLNGSGTITNGAASDLTASLSGFRDAVVIEGAGSVANYGVIENSAPTGGEAAVYLVSGGGVVNGSSADHRALIEGGKGVRFGAGAGAVTNFGSIFATGSSGDTGVWLGQGGTVTNGADADTSALIEGQLGVYAGVAAATVANFGTIASTGSNPAAWLRDGGALYNGDLTDSSALILGGAVGLYVSKPTLIFNLGTIEAVRGPAKLVDAGVVITAGAYLRNGSDDDPSATIIGFQDGVYSGPASASVDNAGTIEGIYEIGVSMAGGILQNGSATDTSAIVRGWQGVNTTSTTVTNLGSIIGTSSYGVELQGGRLLNGSLVDAAARIEGSTGLYLDSHAAAVNYGVIQGDGVVVEGQGVSFSYGTQVTGASLTNGSAQDHRALIEGVTGALLGAGGNLFNWGVITAAGTYAVRLESPTASLFVEAGSTFNGEIAGDGGFLDLQTGVGTITNLAEGDVSVAGSMVPTTFDDFGTLVIGAPASFSLPGTGAVAAGETLRANGTLSIGGTLTVDGTLDGSGMLALASGEIIFGSNAELAVGDTTETGTANAVFGPNVLTYAGVWTQTAGTISVLAGDQLYFTGAGDTFAGTLAGAGDIFFFAGSDTLAGASLTSKGIVEGAAVTLTGTVGLTGGLIAENGSLEIASAGATLSAGGYLRLAGLPSNGIEGQSAGATLVNDAQIEGVGDIGKGEMTLVNAASGVIVGNGAAALVIDTGTKTIANAGVMEATGAGGLSIDSAIANAGTLAVAKSSLDVLRAVTGAGLVKIGADGIADFASSFGEDVDFAGSGGELILDQAFSGAISGFSKTGATALDLRDIAFGGGAKATYSGTSASGILTVTDGSQSARITFDGNYLGPAFTISSDGHGGTKVVDETAPAVTRFVQAAATLGDAGAAPDSAGNALARPESSARQRTPARRLKASGG